MLHRFVAGKTAAEGTMERLIVTAEHGGHMPIVGAVWPRSLPDR
jgi:hypothetical protein